jgi:D-sedoheptulose 7-phosphate isomerase
MSGQAERVAFAKDYLERLAAVLAGVPLGALAQAMALLERAHEDQRQVFIAGNGGSASTAMHMANDLMKGVAKGGGSGLRAIALSDNVSLLTAIANDESYAEVFAGQLSALARPGDLLVVISASGNSPNILRAVEQARQLEVTTIGLLGMGGGTAASMVDCAVVVPADDYGPAEDAHLVCDHLMTAYLRRQASARRRAAPLRR